MKVLYGIQTAGNGHLSRSSLMMQHLKDMETMSLPSDRLDSETETNRMQRNKELVATATRVNRLVPVQI